jgi:hypothetical protein
MKPIKNRNTDDEKRHNEIPEFDNEQMLLHFFDIRKCIQLKFSQDPNSTEKELKITFQNQIIFIEPGVVISAFAYEELNLIYRLEAKYLVELIFSKCGERFSSATKTVIVSFLKEIIEQK